MNKLSPRTVWILAYPQMLSLDVVGPMEVLVGANRALEYRHDTGRGYDVRLITLEPAPQIATESGLSLLAEPLTESQPLPHTLIVPGGEGARDAAATAPYVDWLRARAPALQRIVSVCTGAYLLAAAGLLDGRKASTHWAYAEELASRYPQVSVDGDAIYQTDGKFWTSAGVTAGIDLTLALVEEDLGAEVAQLVARGLVVYRHRPGGQTQFAPSVWNRVPATPPVRSARDLIDAHPAFDHSLETLADRVGISARHLARRFKAEVGTTPAQYVQSVRIDLARSCLEQSSMSLEAVARESGLGSAETLRRLFQQRFGMTPDTYRQLHAQKPTTGELL